MKILIVEDENSLREIIKKALEKENYVVESAENFAVASEKIAVYSYDCILLDIMLPDGSGLAILQKLKEMGKSSNVIIISAKDSIEDKVAGLELGADDYLAKPFHLAELSARIKSVIRRNNQSGKNFIQLGNVKLLPDSNQVFIDDQELRLGKKEFDILRFFMSRCNHVISKDVLAEAVWGDHIDQVDNFDFIYAQIKNIKKKMKEFDATIEIKAIYGFGYKLSEIN